MMWLLDTTQACSEYGIATNSVAVYNKFGQNPTGLFRISKLEKATSDCHTKLQENLIIGLVIQSKKQ